MEGLALLMGHLIGDFIFQNDWQARNKTHPYPGPKPNWSGGDAPVVLDTKAYRIWLEGRNDRAVIEKWDGWEDRNGLWERGHLACTVHCLLYTFAYFATCFWFLSWWAYPVIFLTHWPVDRFRLARRWMKFNRQEEFATGPLAPWSVIVVDNTVHLLVAYAVGLLCVRYGL